MATQAETEIPTIKGRKEAIRKVRGGYIIEQYMASTHIKPLKILKYFNVMKCIADHNDSPLFYKIEAYLRLQGLAFSGLVSLAEKRAYLLEAQALLDEALAVYVHDPEDAAELNSFQAWIEHGSIMCDFYKGKGIA